MQGGLCPPVGEARPTAALRDFMGGTPMLLVNKKTTAGSYGVPRIFFARHPRLRPGVAPQWQ